MIVLKRICNRRLAYVVLFGICIGYFEAGIVVYLRELYYPNGFSFPLVIIPDHLYVVEFFRELASITIIIVVAWLAGQKFWERFANFLIIFGIWDIFYYIFLKVTIGWPLSLMDWDVLFLIPLPWIGPVMAPVSVAMMMITSGLLMLKLSTQGCNLRPSLPVWILSSAGTVIIFYSFMNDTAATLHQQMPQKYMYGLLVLGLGLYVAALWLYHRQTSLS